MNSEAVFSDDIRRFVLSLPSIPYLEAIVLLHRYPSTIWGYQAVAKRLYVQPSLANRILNDLATNGVCHSFDGHADQFIYEPESESLRKLIDDLSVIYAKHLIEITHLIHDNNNNPDSATLFADAFLLRKK
jgi:hypothetical protein